MPPSMPRQAQNTAEGVDQLLPALSSRRFRKLQLSVMGSHPPSLDFPSMLQPQSGLTGICPAGTWPSDMPAPLQRLC